MRSLPDCPRGILTQKCMISSVSYPLLDPFTSSYVFHFIFDKGHLGHVNHLGHDAFVITSKSKTNHHLDHWFQRWGTNVTGWHLPEVHVLLRKHLNHLTRGKEDRLTFLLPLCGKSVDLLWLYKQGHRVIGIDAVSEAATCLFEEAGIPYTNRYCSLIKGWIYEVIIPIPLPNKKTNQTICPFPPPLLI